MSDYLIRLMPSILACLLPLLHCTAESRPDVIHLGATLPLSGNLASYGEQIRHGVELAAADLKAEGNAIALHFEDTPMSGPGVLSAFRQLNDTLKVAAIAGNFSNVAMLTMAPVLRKSHVVAMHTAAMDDEILAAGQGVIFSTNTRVRDEAARMARYAFDCGYHRVAIITIETNFGVEYRKHFKAAFEVLGGDVVADESYQLGDVDYRDGGFTNVPEASVAGMPYHRHFDSSKGSFDVVDYWYLPEDLRGLFAGTGFEVCYEEILMDYFVLHIVRRT